MSKLGVAIIGTGAIADVHIDAYLKFEENCEIRILCDVFRDKAQKMKEMKRLNTTEVLEDWHDILEREDIDIISLCLPPSQHVEAAVAMLSAKKHVLVEKPMALSLADCDAIIDAAKENNVFVSVVSQNRYKIPTMKVKELIDKQVAGRVLTTAVNSLWWRGENYYDIWWRGKWANESGGCMMSHAVHHVDLLQWMVGMPEKVTAIIANHGHSNSECEDIAVAILQYPHMTAQLTASLLAHDEEQEMVFQTEKARLSIPWKLAASMPLENGFPVENTELIQDIQTKYDALPELKLEGHEAQIKNFLDAVKGEAPLLVDGNEGRKAIELVMAVYKSAYTQRTVTLPITPDDDFYHREKILELMPHFNEKTYSKDNYKENIITLGRNVGK